MMLGILLILFVSFLILDVTLATVAIVTVFMPSFWGLALAFVGPPLFAAVLVQFFFWVAPALSDAAELKNAYWALAIGFIAGIVGYFFIPDYLDLAKTPHVEAVPVGQAREYGGTGYRQYVGGKLQAERTFSYVERSIDSEGNVTQTRYSAAPVIRVSAPQGAAVDLVAVAIGSPPFGKWVTEHLPIQGILVRRDRYHEHTLKLARAAGVRIHPHAVLLRLEARSYVELLKAKRIGSEIVFISANLLWLIIASFWGRKSMKDIRYWSRYG